MTGAHTEPGSDSRPQDPDLLPCQQALRDVCDDILSRKPPEIKGNFWEVPVMVTPEEVQRRLRASSIGDLLLKDGDSLSAVPPSTYQPELGLVVGEARLFYASVGVRAWKYAKYRVDPNESDTGPRRIIDYPGEDDWERSLVVKLDYSHDIFSATQKILMTTGAIQAGSLPTVMRDVYASAYAEQGYEGHNQAYRDARDEDEVMNYLDLVKGLYRFA